MELAQVGDVAATGGPWVLVLGILGLIGRGIVTGRLVPRSTLDVLNAQWEARLSDMRDHLAQSTQREQDWQTAYRNEADARDADSAAIAKLMTYAETADRVLQALPGKD